MDAIQPPFSLIHRDAADDVLPWAREHEAGVIVYSPMASGLLTGAFTAARAARLEPGDGRAGDLDFTEPALSANLALADALRPVAERHGVAPAAVAVAWTLTFPGVTGAIVGAQVPVRLTGGCPRRDPGAEGRRPVRHRRRHPGHRRGDRSCIACPVSPARGCHSPSPGLQARTSCASQRPARMS